MTEAPYGTWRSPITAHLIAHRTVTVDGMELDGADAYWVEVRPEEGGRCAIVGRRADGSVEEVLPAPFGCRTLVHEYGGRAFVVDRGTIYFSNFADQRLYRLREGEPPAPLTAPSGRRYADGVLDRVRRRLICVVEDHQGTGEPCNAIAAVSLDDGTVETLVSGSDFYAAPRLDPGGGTLAWISWDHPNMPWDGTELWVAAVAAGGGLGTPARVAGGQDESVCQPEWSPSGILHFVSDRSGWWNLYRSDGRRATPVLPMAAELATAQWRLGTATYGFARAERIVCSVVEEGIGSLGEIRDGSLTRIAAARPLVGRQGLRVAGSLLLYDGASPALPPALVLHDLDTGTERLLRPTGEDPAGEESAGEESAAEDPAAAGIAAEYLSAPEPIRFAGTDGEPVHAFYYPPTNPDFRAPAGERPPLIIISHGGPTGAASPALALATQFWTSRGFAVVDVNYGGSTGYGTAYRRRLNGRWGQIDVCDCAAAARHLVSRGDVDSARLLVRGGSAGGYTTLAMVAFRDLVRAGACYAGISDLELFAAETHKFESRYLDRLVGPLPQARARYRERSPLLHLDRMDCPVLLLHGLEDAVVPPAQAERIYQALKARGLPVAYVGFPGEQHGFRRAESIRRSLEIEFSFYAQVLGLECAEDKGMESIAIENLSDLTATCGETRVEHA